MASPDLPISTLPSYMVNVFGRLFNQRTNNRLFYYSPFTALPQDSMTNYLISIWDNVVGPPWCAAVSAQWTCEMVTMIRLDTPSVLAAAHTPAAAVSAGTIAGDCLPAHVSCAIRRQTNVRGRHGWGMVRIAGIAEASQVHGVLTAGAQALFGTLEGALAANITTGAGFEALAAAQVQLPGGSPLGTPIRLADADDWKHNPVLGSQNSRKIGRGE